MAQNGQDEALPDLATLTPGARRILGVASELFYRHGIHAIGVDTIAAESGVTKRTLYDRFGSKDRLVAAYLMERELRWRRIVEDAVAAPGLSRTERVLAPFDAQQAWAAESPRGCAFINALAELPDVQHPAHRIAADEKRWLRDLFEALANDAHLSDARGVAERLLCLHEGALAIRTALPDVDSIGTARAAAGDLVALAEAGAEAGR